MKSKPKKREAGNRPASLTAQKRSSKLVSNRIAGYIGENPKEVRAALTFESLPLNEIKDFKQACFQYRFASRGDNMQPFIRRMSALALFELARLKKPGMKRVYEQLPVSIQIDTDFIESWASIADKKWQRLALLDTIHIQFRAVALQYWLDHSKRLDQLTFLYSKGVEREFRMKVAQKMVSSVRRFSTALKVYEICGSDAKEEALKLCVALAKSFDQMLSAYKLMKEDEIFFLEDCLRLAKTPKEVSEVWNAAKSPHSKHVAAARMRYLLVDQMESAESFNQALDIREAFLAEVKPTYRMVEKTVDVLTGLAKTAGEFDHVIREILSYSAVKLRLADRTIDLLVANASAETLVRLGVSIQLETDSNEKLLAKLIPEVDLRLSMINDIPTLEQLIGPIIHEANSMMNQVILKRALELCSDGDQVLHLENQYNFLTPFLVEELARTAIRVASRPAHLELKIFDSLRDRDLRERIESVRSELRKDVADKASAEEMRALCDAWQSSPIDFDYALGLWPQKIKTAKQAIKMMEFCQMTTFSWEANETAIRHLKTVYDFCKYYKLMSPQGPEFERRWHEAGLRAIDKTDLRNRKKVSRLYKNLPPCGILRPLLVNKLSEVL